MKKRYAVLLLFALFAATVQCEDITTIDGTVYKDIRVTERTPIGINFVSNDKACWADFRDLPPDVAQKYGYDPAKAAEFEKALAQNQGSTVTGDPAEMVADKAALEEDTIPPAVATPVQGVNVAVNTPVANATITTAPPPPQVIVVNNGDTVVYDQQIIYEPTTTIWVSWCGRYYPRSYWHYWYWKDRYVCWSGRYYPAHCFYRGGVWDQGKYYKYAPDPRRNFPAGDRDSRHSYSARRDNHDTGKINTVNSDKHSINQAQPTVNDNRRQPGSRIADNKNQLVTNNDRDSNKNQAVVNNSRITNQVQTVNNDNRSRVQNVVSDNRKSVPAVQVDNQNSIKAQNNDNRVRIQNVINENRKSVPAVQVDNQSSVKTQISVKESRVTNQVQTVNNDNRVKGLTIVNDNRKPVPAVQIDNQSSVKIQNQAKDNRGSSQIPSVVPDSRAQNAANDSLRSAQTVPAITGSGSDSRGASDNIAGGNNRGWDRGEGRR